MGSKPKKPKVEAAPDPQVEAQKAADLATQKANSETASRKKRLQESSLLSTVGAQGTARGRGASQTVLEQGKRTLGA